MNHEANQSCSTVKHLEALVSFDTQNPPRNISVESDIFLYLKKYLSGFQLTTHDAGDGCISLLATRGNPDLLFNFHIDTVPIANSWTSDPLKLVITEEKITGLGACDIKGAAACMLTAITKTKGDVALLFSSDEEHGSSLAVKSFLQTEHGFNQVIVAEPTQARAILAHRGIQSAKATFKGESGHASDARAIKDNAIHKACQWSTAVIQWLGEQNFNFDSLNGLPFNIGKIEGGIKANMIAADCELAFGFRPLPGQDSQALLSQFKSLSGVTQNASSLAPDIAAGFHGPTLPAANQNFNDAITNATRLAEQYELPLGSAVNFWTEASLFSQSGLTAIVYGPGNIEQAHTANEWVSLKQLKQVEEQYIQIISKHQSPSEMEKGHE